MRGNNADFIAIPKAGSSSQRRRYLPQHAAPDDVSGTQMRNLNVAASTAPFKKRAELREEKQQLSLTRRFARSVGEYSVIIVVALVLSTLIRAFLFQAFWIPSGSMKNTLEIGDSVAVSRLTPSVWNIERGDVVVFYDAHGWLPPVPQQTGFAKYSAKTLEFLGLRPASGEQFLVKRVIGLPGDKIKCCNDLDQVLINDKPVSEPYLAPGSYNSMLPYEVVVPAGKLWVLGDNRNNSADSRAHLSVNGGMVNVEDVVGKAVAVMWPYKNWKNPTDHSPFVGIPVRSQD